MTGNGTFEGMLIGVNNQGQGVINLHEFNDLSFYTQNAQRMILKFDGSIGIGTTDPSALLHSHKGGSIENVIKITNSSTGGTSSDGLDMGVVSSGEGIINLHENEDLSFHTNNTFRMIIKNDGTVGIGTSAPSNELEVVGSASNGVAGFTRSDIAQSAKSHILHGSNGDWYIRPAVNTGKIIIADDGGNVGIGTDTPTHPLQMGSGAHCTAAGVWTDASDISKKYEIKPLQYGLADILSLSPKSYTYKIDHSESIGFIAQEMEKVIPEVVSGVEGKKGIAYGQLTAVLVNAVIEQQRQIELLKQENTTVIINYEKLRADHEELKDTVLRSIEKLN